MATTSPKPCHCCEGSGVETDDLVQGRALSGLRLRKGISLRSMARCLNISHSYLCLLEQGKRRWSAGLFERYHVVLAMHQKGKP